MLSSTVVPTSLCHIAVGDDKFVYVEEYPSLVLWSYFIFLENGRIVFCHFKQFTLLQVLTGARLMNIFNFIPGKKGKKCLGCVNKDQI